MCFVLCQRGSTRFGGCVSRSRRSSVSAMRVVETFCKVLTRSWAGSGLTLLPFDDFGPLAAGGGLNNSVSRFGMDSQPYFPPRPQPQRHARTPRLPLAISISRRAMACQRVGCVEVRARYVCSPYIHGGCMYISAGAWQKLQMPP